MTICPIAIAVGCQKCPVFKICPVKSVLGDAPPAAADKPVASTSTKKTPKKTTTVSRPTPSKKAVSRKKTG